MGLPRHRPPVDSGSGHGPFGDKAFHGALIGCVVLVLIGAVMLLTGGEAARSVGTVFIVLNYPWCGLLQTRAAQRPGPRPGPWRRRKIGPARSSG